MRLQSVPSGNAKAGPQAGLVKSSSTYFVNSPGDRPTHGIDVNLSREKGEAHQRMCETILALFADMSEPPGSLTRHLKTSLDIPRLTPAAQTYLELARQPDPDIGTVADALANQPDAAQRMIALANSDLFTRHRHSANLHQAIVNLGVKEALILSVACEAFTALRMIPAGKIDRDAFEHRICIAAAWGKTLGSEFGRRDSAELLLATVIQDAGLLLIAHGVPGTYADLDPLATGRRTLAQLESAALHTDHRQTSAWLASTWQFPDNVIRTLRLGHDLAAEDIAHRERGFYRAVNFCGDLAEIWCRPLTAQIVEQIAADAQRYLGICPDRLAELFGTVAAQVAQLASILGLGSHAPTQYETTARQARDLLPISNVRTLAVHVSRGVYAPRATSATPAPNLLDQTDFAARLDEEFTLAARHNWPLSLLLVEIDDFKDLHDCSEPASSAQTWHDIAVQLGSSIRSSDTIAPQGADRFAILLPGTDADKAASVAKRLVNEIRRNAALDKDAGSFSATVSLGVATLNQDTPFSRSPELYAAATAALEHSTNTGRDRHTTYAGIQAA